MKWDEFADLLSGLSPDTALGRIVSIRSEDDKDMLKHFTKDQHRIRNAWRSKRAKKLATSMPREQMDAELNAIKNAFIAMAGIGGDTN